MDHATQKPTAGLSTDPGPFQLDAWRVEPETGLIADGETQLTLEPRLMALLTLLATTSGRVLSREAIEAALWPDVVVGEDTLARAISRLRRALGDSAQAPRYIETLPKRGYRLMVAATPLTAVAPSNVSSRRRRLAIWLPVAAIAAAIVSWQARTPESITESYAEREEVERADDLYMRFTNADNETAIGLYERVLSDDPDNAGAHAGLANALVQRVVRWPRNTELAGASSMRDALERGLTQQPEAKAVLSRARAMAERGARLAPRDPDALKALAFVHTAQGDLQRSETYYQQTLELDPDHWPALVNLGELAAMRGDPLAAVDYLEQAWAAMDRVYASEPQRAGVWQVGFGIVIAQSYEALEQPADAEIWYRRVLAKAPYEPQATAGLAQLLAASGEAGEARALCQALIERLGAYPACDAL